jgi:glycine cleavage system H protein
MNQLIFPMGQYDAPIPTGRQYTENHLWALPLDGEQCRFGLTAYAVRLLSDVYFLEWTVDSGTQLAKGQPIGEIESKKAESQLYSPTDGRMSRINERVLYDPAIINQDTYGQGWMFELDSVRQQFLSPADYLDHLQATWHLTQKLIKQGSCKFL